MQEGRTLVGFQRISFNQKKKKYQRRGVVTARKTAAFEENSKNEIHRKERSRCGTNEIALLTALPFLLGNYTPLLSQDQTFFFEED